MAVVEQIETAGGGRRRLALSNPATLEAVGEIDVQTAADVAAAVERARKPQREWAELGIPGRARYLERALAHIRKHDAVWITTGSAITDWYKSKSLS